MSYYARDREKTLSNSASSGWSSKPYYPRERDKSDPFASASLRSESSAHYKPRDINSKQDNISTLVSGNNRVEPSYYREREKLEAYYRERDSKPDYGSATTTTSSHYGKRVSEAPAEEMRGSSVRYALASQQQSQRSISEDYVSRSRQASVVEGIERRAVSTADESIKSKSIGFSSTARKPSASSGSPEPRSRESSHSSIKSDLAVDKPNSREPVSNTTIKPTEISGPTNKLKDTIAKPKESLKSQPNESTTIFKEPITTSKKPTVVANTDKEVVPTTAKVNEFLVSANSAINAKESVNELKSETTTSDSNIKSNTTKVEKKLIEVNPHSTVLESSKQNNTLIESNPIEIKPEIFTDTDTTMHNDLPVKEEPVLMFPLNRLESALYDVQSLSKAELHKHMKYFSGTPIKSFNEYPFYRHNINFNNKFVHSRIMAAVSEHRKAISQSTKIDQERFNILKAAWLGYCRLVEAKEEQQLQNNSSSAANLAALGLQDPVSPSSRSTRHRKNHGDSVRSEAEFLEILADLERQSARDPSLRATLTSATIPPMIYDPVQRDELRYQDTNNVVLEKSIPYQRLFTDGIDDFTEEEHETFCEAYLAAPKQFGKIAQRMGGLRTFNDCVMHYYRTKKQVDYKAMLAANTRAKRGTKKSKRKLVKRVSSEEEDLSTFSTAESAVSVPPFIKEESELSSATPVPVVVAAGEGPAAKWTMMETALFQQLIMSYGTDFTKIAAALKNKRSVAAVREHFERIGPERGWAKLAASVDDKIRRGLPVALPPKQVQHQVSHQQQQVTAITNKRKRVTEDSSVNTDVNQTSPPRKVAVTAVEKKIKDGGDSVMVKLSMPQGVVAAAAAKQAATEAKLTTEKEVVPAAEPKSDLTQLKTVETPTEVDLVPVPSNSVKLVTSHVDETKLVSNPVEPALVQAISKAEDTTKLVVEPIPAKTANPANLQSAISVPESNPASSVTPPVTALITASVTVPVTDTKVTAPVTAPITAPITAPVTTTKDTAVTASFTSPVSMISPVPSVTDSIAASSFTSVSVGSVASVLNTSTEKKGSLLSSLIIEPQNPSVDFGASSVSVHVSTSKESVVLPPTSRTDELSVVTASIPRSQIDSPPLNSSSAPAGSLYNSAIETRKISEPLPPSLSPTQPTRTALPPLLHSHQYARPLLPSISAQSPLYAYSHNQIYKAGSPPSAVDVIFSAAIAAGVGSGPGGSSGVNETGAQHLPPLPSLHQYHTQSQQQSQSIMAPLPPLNIGVSKPALTPAIKSIQDPVQPSTKPTVSVSTPTSIVEADESMAAAAAALGSLANAPFARPCQAAQYAPTQQTYVSSLQPFQNRQHIQQKQNQQYHSPKSISELFKYSLVPDQANSSTLNALSGVGSVSVGMGAGGSLVSGSGVSGDGATTQEATGFDCTHVGLTRESSERFQARTHQQQRR